MDGNQGPAADPVDVDVIRAIRTAGAENRLVPIRVDRTFLLFSKVPFWDPPTVSDYKRHYIGRPYVTLVQNKV